MMRWPAAEDAVFTAAWTRGGIYAAMTALPNRSKRALFARALRLRLPRCRRWSAAEDYRLRSIWGAGTIHETAKAMNRTPLSVYLRAIKLRLKTGIPDGHEYIAHAASRLGYAEMTLAKILRYAGVKLVPYLSPSSKKLRCVDSFDADEAVALWMSTEVLEVAARGRHMSSEALRQWLIDAGHEPPRRKTRGCYQWRIPTKVIDQVVSERRSKEGICAAADRVGVCEDTLRKWLIDTGVPRGSKRVWLLDPAVVDRVVAEKRDRRRAA